MERGYGQRKLGLPPHLIFFTFFFFQEPFYFTDFLLSIRYYKFPLLHFFLCHFFFFGGRWGRWVVYSIRSGVLLSLLLILFDPHYFFSLFSLFFLCFNSFIMGSTHDIRSFQLFTMFFCKCLFFFCITIFPLSFLTRRFFLKPLVGDYVAKLYTINLIYTTYYIYEVCSSLLACVFYCTILY